MKIEICNENSRIPGDPECSSDAEIDDWVTGKSLEFKVIESKFDPDPESLTNIVNKITP